MTSSIAPSIFSPFNARSLKPSEVAASFIPPNHYDTLIKRAHSIVIGPRGSGKTTLLKMLQPAALESWHHPDADEYRSLIDYTGVFIPTDRSWSAQINSIGEHQLEPSQQRLLGVATFTTHVLRALVDAMQYRVHPPDVSNLTKHRRVSLSRQDEATLVNELANQWELQVTVPSLLSLKYALTARFSKIKQLSSRETHISSEGRSQRLAETTFLHLHFLSSATQAIEIFDDLTVQTKNRWALLFDELELAPKVISEELIDSLRGIDERWLFKLSLSPYSEDVRLLHDALSAMPGNDYDPIPLWYAHKEEGYPFCTELLQSLLDANNMQLTAPEKIFGRSEFETAYEDWAEGGSAYSPGSRLQQRFLRMAGSDKSFEKHLQSFEIDPHKLHQVRDVNARAEIRKISPLLIVREAFRGVDIHDSTERIRTRSRKNPTIYGGATALFAMVEGNPRWFKGIIGELIQLYKLNQKRVHPAKQTEQVEKAANKFRALLKTIPCPVLKQGQKPRGLLSLLDIIGRYFHRVVVKEDFNANPYGSFTVDAHTRSELVHSLGLALNAGAIVYVPDEDSQHLIGSLIGKRFRLTYLLSPHYGIPIRLGRPLSLNTIISSRQEKDLFSGLDTNE